MTETRDYDEAGRLLLLKSTQSSAPVASFGYTYDANGNRATQVETRTGSSPETTTYGYDDANRLVAVAYPEETVLYSLDAVGNRKGEKKALPGVVAALTVAAYAALSPANASAMTERTFNAVDWMVASHQLVPAGLAPLAIAYDANGNRVSQGPRTYAWDIRDTLTTVTESGSTLGTYDYDAQLQRVKADTADGHVEYALDGQFVLRESGARNRRYHFGEGEGLGVSDAAGPRWLLDDAQGSVSVEVSLASGGGSTPAAIAATTHRKYDAWGNYRSGTAPAGAEARLGYTGHQYDVESGLTYARARYYDSVNGVFLSRDSVEGSLSDAPSLHRFAYAHVNPLRYTDTSGRCPNCVAAAVGAGIGFLVGFGAALLDGDTVGDAAVTGLKGAAVGALAGLTFGASAAVGGTAFAAKAAVVGATVGLGLNVTQQALAKKAGLQSEYSVKEMVFSAGTGAALPTGKTFAALPSAAKTAIGLLGVAGGAAAMGQGGSQVSEGLERGNPWEVALGTTNTVLGVVGVGAGARVIPGPRAPATSATEVLATTLTPRPIGERTPPQTELGVADIERIKTETAEVGGDPSVLRFNEGRNTGYIDSRDVINVRGDVLPLEGENHPRSSMSSRAVMAHEFGHRRFSGTPLEPGAWNDEFRASYVAATKAPNLSAVERRDLILDAMSRAQEARPFPVPIRPNPLMRYLTTGYGDPSQFGNWVPPEGFEPP